MRGLDTPVRKVRRKVFTEIARLGFANRPETLISDIEEIPYKIVQEKACLLYTSHYIGNSSLAGAYGMLLSTEAEKKTYELASNMTYLELSTVPTYMDEFVAACFLPHTDTTMFPSAEER